MNFILLAEPLTGLGREERKTEVEERGREREGGEERTERETDRQREGRKERESVGGTRRKPLATSFRKCHILKT